MLNGKLASDELVSQDSQGNLLLPPGLVKLADGRSAAASSTTCLDRAAGYTGECLKETILYSNQGNAMTPDTLFNSADYQVTL